MRKAGIKPNYVAASEITKAADAIIARDPSIIAKARENLDSRAKLTSTIDVRSIVQEDPKLIAKAKKAKEERASQLSAK